VTSDAELIAWSLAGDDDAFVQVVRRHAGALSAYLVRRVGRDAAEDLLGDVWVAAFVSRASYNRSFAGARPWLFGIARNTLRAHWRNALGEELMSEMAELPVVLNPWPELDERIDADAVVRRRFTSLRRALVGLPSNEREVLLLVAWERLSVAETARALGIPAGTARYRLHRARLALRAVPDMVEILTEINEIREA
jgi:RNA polymerase sigma-70 factor (ECF subfamily)